MMEMAGMRLGSFFTVHGENNKNLGTGVSADGYLLLSKSGGGFQILTRHMRRSDHRQAYTSGFMEFVDLKHEMIAEFSPSNREAFLEVLTSIFPDADEATFGTFGLSIAEADITIFKELCLGINEGRSTTTEGGSFKGDDC